MMERVGECDSCGGRALCCTFLRLQVPPSYGSDPDIRKWVELHGVRLIDHDGGTFAMLPQRCSALTEEGLCSLYGTSERPDLCSQWPASPAALLGVEDDCSYKFVEVSHAGT